MNDIRFSNASKLHKFSAYIKGDFQNLITVTNQFKKAGLVRNFTVVPHP